MLLALGALVYTLGAYGYALSGFSDRLARCDGPDVRTVVLGVVLAPVAVPAVAVVRIVTETTSVYDAARRFCAGHSD